MKRIISFIIALTAVHSLQAQEGQGQDIHVNLGGPDVYYQGTTFESDLSHPGYFGGSTIFATAQGTAAVAPSIFHTERYSPSSGGQLVYTVPVANGAYTVRTHHSELWFGKGSGTAGQAGQRVFSITVEGDAASKVGTHDLYVLNGNNPLTHTFENIVVNDGVLDLVLDASVQHSTVAAISVEGPENVYINVGSDDDIEFNGKLYLGDIGKGFSAGNAHTNTGASTEPIFQTERYMYPTKTELTYAVPVINGAYTVKTHHNELYFGKSALEPNAMEGQRVFDIQVENRAMTGFDLHKRNNEDPNADIGDPYTNEFTGVTVSDGILNITLSKVEENPSICGIAIESADGNGTDMYINTGGGDVVYEGKDYLAENKVLATNNAGSSVHSDATPISPMFMSEHYGSAEGGTLSYTIPVTPNQAYTVRTHHNELYFGKSTLEPVATAGQRVMDILVEGQVKAANFDLYAKNGNSPYTHTFENVAVGADGILNIDFDASVQRANVAGISIEGSGTNIHINAGSGENRTYDGREYVGELATGFSASATFSHVPASDEALFRTERYMQPSKTELTYGVPVPNGTYTVRTHHNELWFGKAGGGTATTDQRKFDIYVEGNLEFDDFDLAAENVANGNPIGAPITKTVANVSVTDGILDILLAKVTDNPNISGISIERTDTGGTEIYINCGGGAVDYQGNTYKGEQEVFVTNNSKGNVYNRDIVTGDLFQSERYAATGTLSIAVPVGNGIYTLRTYHNELWFGVHPLAPPTATSNQRRKDIAIEGELVQGAFDLFDHTSGTNEPTVLVHEGIEVADGQLDLVVTGVVENPNLNAFSIIRTGDLAPPEEEGDETKAPYANINLSNGQNYVLTRTYHERMGSFSPVNESDVMEQVTYFDGLGRPMQDIAMKASQDKKDIVTHIGYDDYGRMGKEFLPYEAPIRANEALGSLRPDAEGDTYGYYTSNYSGDLDANVPNPFSQKKFEPSPLNRVVKQAAPGKDWKLGSGHEIRFDYLTNTATEVLLFKVGFTNNDTEAPQLAGGTSYYGTGELYKNVTKDENWSSGSDHTTEEFTDKQGRTVLKRTYNNNDPHDTYYVHDDFGNLTYVIPPKVALSITDGVSTTEMGELCYQYRYDHRNRLIEKKIPGKGWEYIVYNKLDQPIMTKDSQNDWLFTKYDAFGRVAYTGFATGGDRPSVQSSADAHGTQWTNQTGTTTIDGQTVYYDDGGYPSASGITKLHTINYYDNYDQTRDDGLAAPTGSVQGQAVSTDAKRLATVSRIRVLDQDDWITTLIAYDAKGRPIHTKSKNDYLNTVDIIETKLDFAGKPIETSTSHQKDGGTPIVTIDRFDYDHANRLLKQRQALAGKTEMIAFNTYDGIGQLTGKKVGNTKADALQTINYGYNIRGWLTDINDVANLGDKLFAFGVNYNSPTHGATALYNGNISETEWRTANTDNSLKWYRYGYDPLNRITSAIDDTGNYSLENVSYDKMGNITNLKRKGHTNNGATSFGVMDDLTYSYTGNQLKAVDDDIASNATQGFVDGAELATEYTYDANGNQKTDSNKGITGITYNHFDLPTEIVFDNNPNKKVRYVYGADMKRLKKFITENGVTSTVDYAGRFIYENDNLRFMSHREGYTVPDGNNWDYIYQFRDNLGNVRLSYGDINKDGSVDSSEILHERNPYPFGMAHKGYNGNIQGAENNYADFQGQELDKSLNLNWHHFKYRTYDKMLGRFLQIDPLATTYEYNSTYAFAENNPTTAIDLEGKEKSFELDGNRATLVKGPVKNGLTLQEAASLVAQQKSERDALMNKITPKYDGAQSSAGNINYSTTHIDRAAAVYPQSGLRKAQTLGVAAKEAATDFFGGALIVGGIRALRGANSVWNLGRFARGRSIERTLGANQQWARNFPVIDKIQDGAATSIKSLDLTAKSYQKGNGLLNTLKGYVNKLDNFGGRTRWGGVTVEEGVDYSSKTLELAVETGQGTAEQWNQINKAIDYALDKDINFTIRFID